MGFVEAVKTCFRKYFIFSGRASRPEYWWFMLFFLLVSTMLGWFDSALYRNEPINKVIFDEFTYATYRTTGPFAEIFGLAALLPLLSAGWRRMHDTGRSGFYLLCPLILMICIGIALFFSAFFDMAEATGMMLVLPFFFLLISPLLVLWWLVRPSEPGPNLYGPNPHEVTP